MSSRVILPQPKNEFDPVLERVRNHRIQDALADKLDNHELPQYPGTPHIAMKGSNVAWSSPGNNVIVSIPWDVVMQSNPDMLVGTVIKLAFVMNVIFYVNLFHVSGAGGNAAITFYVYLDGVAYASATKTTQLNDNESYANTFFGFELPAGKVITFRMSHTSNQTLIIDMTKSRQWITQLTPNPNYVDRSRL